MLTASARSRKREARAISTLGIAGIGRGDLDGDDEAPRLAGLLEAECFAHRRRIRPDDGRRRMRAVDHPQPGRAIPQPVIDRLEEGLVARRADPLHAVGRLDPDTAHRRIDLAGAVGAHAAARAVAHLLGAIGRAGHAGRRKHALAAHLAIDKHLLGGAFERAQHALHALRPQPLQRPAQMRREPRAGVVGALERRRVPHTPMPQRLHAVVPGRLVDMSTRIWHLPRRLFDFGQALRLSIKGMGRGGHPPTGASGLSQPD